MDAPLPDSRIRSTLDAPDEQIGVVVGQGTWGAWSAMMVTVAYAVVVWPFTNHRVLIAWFVIANLIGAVRIALARIYQAGQAHWDWRALCLLFGALSGAVWGFASIALLPLGHTELYFAVAFMLIGMPAGALTSFGAWVPAYACYLLFSVVPFVTRLLLTSSDEYTVITGIAGVVFGGFILRGGWVSSQMIRHNIEQRLEVERMTQSLVEARDAAESANRSKSSFLANMSHEFRSPLHAVVGMSELLLEVSDLGKARNYAETIRVSALSLVGLINDVLDLSRIEAGALSLREDEFDLHVLVNDITSMFQANVEGKGLLLRQHIAANVPTRVRADPVRLRQVIVNLLGNAIKFTEAGTVALRVDVASSNQPRDLLRFEITDTGIGIDATNRDAMFKAFSQLDNSATRVFGGTGLGLRICAELVELMGGTIDFRSEPDKGATFWFTAFVEPARELLSPAPVTAAPFDAKSVTGARALVVEDNYVNQTVAVETLRNYGCLVSMAATGAEALQALRAAHFDIVLMDCQMPVMDGFEATRQWRAHEQANGLPRTTIVALTANAIAGDRERCLACGMDDYVSKPFSRVRIEEVLQQYVSSDASVGQPASQRLLE